MKITLIDRIKTDFSPYTITFPSDGRWLTYGDGMYYGGGHIGCIKPGQGIVTQLTCSDILPDDKRNHISISGLCYDGKGHFLAVAAWSFTHFYYPAMLFRIDGNHIIPHTSFLDSPQDLKQLHIGNRGYATGILLHQGQIIIRRATNSSDQVFSAWRLPVEIDTKSIPYHVTSSRMIPLKNAVATCYNESVLITEIDGAQRFQTHTLPSPHQGEAITVNTAGNTIITGGHDGSIAFWKVSYSVDGLPNVQLISTVPPLEKPSQLTGREFYYYDPESIVATCYIADSNFFAVAEASGRMSIWKEKEVLHTWFVPAGSPRAMASHPTRPILAIGCKKADERGVKGMIVLYELEV